MLRLFLNIYDTNMLQIPKVYDEYTTERVLTMEYCDGAQINDCDYFKQNKINRYDVSSAM